MMLYDAVWWYMMGNDGYLCLLRFIFFVAFLHSCILDMNLLPSFWAGGISKLAVFLASRSLVPANTACYAG
jgi:hypothetical protein